MKPKKKDSGELGCSSKSAATDCLAIIRDRPFKKSGFYWLQNKCAKQAIRMFCDFQVQRQGVAYGYYGGIGGG